MPWRISSPAISAWMSEKPMTKSGRSSRIAPIFALVKALTFGFSLRAMVGRTVKPLMPTMRSCSPSAYRVSVGSSVRQTMRCGGIGSGIQHARGPGAVVRAFVRVAFMQAVLGAVPELHPARPHAEAGPAWRARHVPALEARRGLGQACIECFAGVEGFGLQ